MAVEQSGALHIAGVQDRAGAQERDLVYLTNANGEWIAQRPATPQGIGRLDDVAAIEVDATGRIAVAYERRDCRVGGCMESGGQVRVAVIEPATGSSEAVQLGEGLSPSMALHHGVVHVVWLAGRWSDDGGGCPRPAMYATNASGE